MTSLFLQTVVFPWVQALGLALIPVLGGVVLQVLHKRNVDTTWFEAVGRAGGAGLAAVVTAGVNPASKEGLELGAKAGADYLLARVPGLVAARDLSPEAVAQIAGAELGKLLNVTS